jgi:multidrug resistance efflux pump
MKFRLQALIHQGEPDELDIVPRLVRPRGVLAVVVLAAVIVGVLVWSFVGDLPRRISASGVLSPDSGISTVQSTSAGIVQKVEVSSADPVTAGQSLVTVVDPAGKSTTVSSPIAGQTITVSVAAGEQVDVGTPLATVVPTKDGEGPDLSAVLFVPSSSAAQLAPGMKVQMSIDTVPSSVFGLVKGEVSSVEPYPVTTGEALAVTGNDLTAATFVKGGPVRLVHIKLDPSSSTRSGYAWTTKAGPPFSLLAQGLLSGTVHVSNEHPINLVFGR